MRVINSMPTAITAGPRVIGTRGPIRWASAPARAENASMIIVIGSVASACLDR